MGERDWYSIAEQPAPAPHLAHPEGCTVLRIVLVILPLVSRSDEHFPDGFDLQPRQYGVRALGFGGKSDGPHTLNLKPCLCRVSAARAVDDLTTTTSQKCAVVPRWARVQGAYDFASLDSRLENNKK